MGYVTKGGHWLCAWLDPVRMLTSSVYATACTGLGPCSLSLPIENFDTCSDVSANNLAGDTYT